MNKVKEIKYADLKVGDIICWGTTPAQRIIEATIDLKSMCYRYEIITDMSPIDKIGTITTGSHSIYKTVKILDEE